MTFGHPRSLDYRIGTALAHKLGLHIRELPYDERPVGELVAENFPTAEGIYGCLPNHPPRGLHKANFGSQGCKAYASLR